MKRRRWALLAVVAVAATACPPPETPGPSTPAWTATRFARSVAGDVDPFVYIDSWTNDDWFATTTLSGNFVSTLQFRPRSGAGGATLGPPQVVSPTIQGARFLDGADPDGQLLGLRGFENSAPAVEFLSETGGVWSIIGTSALTHPAVAMNDHWLITRSDPLLDGNPSTLSVFAIDTTGPDVVLSFVQTLAPDPAWSTNRRTNFGTTVALDGDLLAVGAPVTLATPPTLVPGAVRVFRSDGAGWDPVQTIDGVAAGRMRFGTELAADDGATVDRIALSATAPLPDGSEYGPTSVEVYADSGSGFAPEQTLVPDVGDPDVNQGSYFGSSMSLDGDLIAVASRIVDVPAATPGSAPGRGGYVKLFRLGATWTEEAEVATFVDPLPAGFGVMRPTELKVSGEHVAVVTFAPEQECGFEPCVDFSFEAWALDHTG